MSFKMLSDASPRLYFWRFTSRCPESDRDFARCFHDFIKSLLQSWNDSRFMALRNFEAHDGGGERHGHLHAHMVCNQRLPGQMVWRIAAKHGIGHLDVREVKGDRTYVCEYMAKYLSPSSDSSAKGVRRWARIGEWGHQTVKGIFIESKSATEFRETAAIYAGHPRQWKMTRAHVQMRRNLSDEREAPLAVRNRRIRMALGSLDESDGAQILRSMAKEVGAIGVVEVAL